MTVAMLIENLQTLQQDLQVMVYDESSGKLQHVVLAEIEDRSPVPGRIDKQPETVIRLFTHPIDL